MFVKPEDTSGYLCNTHNVFKDRVVIMYRAEFDAPSSDKALEERRVSKLAVPGTFPSKSNESCVTSVSDAERGAAPTSGYRGWNVGGRAGVGRYDVPASPAAPTDYRRGT